LRRRKRKKMRPAMPMAARPPMTGPAIQALLEEDPGSVGAGMGVGLGVGVGVGILEERTDGVLLDSEVVLEVDVDDVVSVGRTS
jgi:hypothetical protein